MQVLWCWSCLYCSFLSFGHRMGMMVAVAFALPAAVGALVFAGLHLHLCGLNVEKQASLAGTGAGCSSQLCTPLLRPSLSQNHCMVWVGGDLKIHLVPLPAMARGTFL